MQASECLREWLASNLLERDFRVTAVAPGLLWTPLNPADKPAEKAEFGKHSDMGQSAQTEEVSPVMGGPYG